jgi:hypothetical protein
MCDEIYLISMHLLVLLCMFKKRRTAFLGNNLGAIWNFSGALGLL